ncbi:hypothetical protein VUR80DRAFT_6702 [Thermomyces stellatus]
MATGGSVLWFWPDGLGFHIFTLSSWSLICHCQTRYFLFCTHFVIRKVSCTSPCLLLDFWCSLNCGDPLISLQPVSVNELITAASAKRVVPFPWSIVFWCPGTTRTEERGKETTGDPLAVSTHNPLLPLLPRKKKTLPDKSPRVRPCGASFDKDVATTHSDHCSRFNDRGICSESSLDGLVEPVSQLPGSRCNMHK